MTPFENGWAIVGSPTHDSIDKLWGKLKTYGIKPKEFMMYGDIRTFVRANELNEDEAIAFHKGRYIGNLEQTSFYLEGYGKPAE